jgi:hypothetical protein
MTKLSIANNMLATKSNAKAAGEALGEMLKGSVILKELDVSGNAPSGYSTDGPSFAAGISQGLSDNGALSSANLLGNRIGIDQAKALATILKEHSALKSLCGNRGDETELDMRGKKIDAEGAIMLAPEIIDNGALLSANLLKNNIPVEQAQELVRIMQSHKTLTTLCGLSGKETELNMSGKMRGAGGAIMLAPEIIDNGVLLVLSLKNNSLGTKEAGKVLGEILKANSVLKELDLSSNHVHPGMGGHSLGFAQELANGIKDNRALSSANLLANNISIEQASALAIIPKPQGAPYPQVPLRQQG